MTRKKGFWESLFGTGDDNNNKKETRSETERRTSVVKEEIEGRSEAGRKGGEAPHVCRGRECNHGSGERDE